MSPRRQPRSAVTCRISAHQNTKNVTLLSAMNTTCMTKAPRSASVALMLVDARERGVLRDECGRHGRAFLFLLCGGAPPPPPATARSRSPRCFDAMFGFCICVQSPYHLVQRCVLDGDVPDRRLPQRRVDDLAERRDLERDLELRPVRAGRQYPHAG